MEILFAVIGIGIALFLVARSQRKADEYYEQGMKEYHRKMREIHGDKYRPVR